MKLVIGNKNYSSWSLRPWLLMKVLAIPFEEQIVPLYEGDSKARLLALSPAGKVPVLIDGELTIWDSLAIAEYLAEKFPALPLWPIDPVARAQARCVSAEMHSGFSALRTHMPMNCRASHPGQGQNADVRADIARIVGLWRDCRRHFGADGEFLFGAFSVADAMYAPVVSRFKTYGVELPDIAQAYVDAMLALPAMRDWYAAGQVEPQRIAASEPYAVMP